MNEQNKKTLLLSYNIIGGFPPGRFEDDKVIVVSAWRKEYSGKDPNIMLDKLLKSELTPPRSDLIERAIIYVGNWGCSKEEIDNALGMMNAFRKPGKEIRIVGCGCNIEDKLSIAKHVGGTYEICECGGLFGMGRLAKEFQQK